MKIKIRYSYDPMLGPVLGHTAHCDELDALAVGGSFEDAKARLLAKLQHTRGVSIPAPEEVEL